MAITKEEVDEAIALYDKAMTGDIDALLKVLDLYTKATCGDYNAEGLAWAITYEKDLLKIGVPPKNDIQGNKKSQ